MWFAATRDHVCARVEIRFLAKNSPLKRDNQAFLIQIMHSDIYMAAHELLRLGTSQSLGAMASEEVVLVIKSRASINTIGDFVVLMSSQVAKGLDSAVQTSSSMFL